MMYNDTLNQSKFFDRPEFFKEDAPEPGPYIYERIVPIGLKRQEVDPMLIRALKRQYEDPNYDSAYSAHAQSMSIF